MNSSNARSPVGKRLLEFADKNRLDETWEDCISADVTAQVSGWRLDNRNASQRVINGDINDEMLITLKSPEGELVLNMNDVLAMAATYVRVSYERAKASLRPQKLTVHR